MSATYTYALWIIPDGAAYTLTNGYIAKLSSAYHIPRFEPHVTILGGIRSAEKSLVRGLAEGLAPFRIQLANEVEYLDEYFRCLFLRAQKTPELMNTFSKASGTFGYEDDLYFPHLSLAYGEFSLQTKRDMIRELGAISKVEFEARSIHLVHASTEMPIVNWKIVERFSLGNV